MISPWVRSLAEGAEALFAEPELEQTGRRRCWSAWHRRGRRPGAWSGLADRPALDDVDRGHCHCASNSTLPGHSAFHGVVDLAAEARCLGVLVEAQADHGVEVALRAR